MGVVEFLGSDLLSTLILSSFFLESSAAYFFFDSSSFLASSFFLVSSCCFFLAAASASDSFFGFGGSSCGCADFTGAPVVSVNVDFLGSEGSEEGLVAAIVSGNGVSAAFTGATGSEIVDDV